jgi:phosphoribosylformylglycinamidine cyclo-ligase
MDSAEMYSAFNMGVGMVVICEEADANSVLASSAENGVEAWRAGRIVSGNGNVEWE